MRCRDKNQLMRHAHFPLYGQNSPEGDEYGPGATNPAAQVSLRVVLQAADT